MPVVANLGGGVQSFSQQQCTCGTIGGEAGPFFGGAVSEQQQQDLGAELVDLAMAALGTQHQPGGSASHRLQTRTRIRLPQTLMGGGCCAKNKIVQLPE